MKWFLIVDGKKEVFDDGEAGLSKYKELVKEKCLAHPYSIGNDQAEKYNPFLSHFYNDRLNCADDAKECIDYMAGQKPAFNHNSTYLDRKGDSFDDESFAYCHAFRGQIGVFLSRGRFFIRSIFSNNTFPSFSFFRCNFTYQHLGFFVNKNEQKEIQKNTFIMFVDSKTYEKIEELERLIGLDGLSKYLVDHRRNLEDIYNYSFVISPRLAYQLANECKNSFKHLKKIQVRFDMKHSLILFKHCFDIAMNDTTNAFDDSFIANCCYNIADCFLKLDDPVNAIAYLKEGANKNTGDSNDCAFMLAQFCLRPKYLKLRGTMGNELLKKTDEFDYLIKSGSLGYQQLGDYYFKKASDLGNNDYLKQAIECYEKADTDTCLSLASFCHILLKDYNESSRIIRTLYFNEDLLGHSFIAYNLAVSYFYYYSHKPRDEGITYLIDYLEKAAWPLYASHKISPEWYKAFSPVFYNIAEIAWKAHESQEPNSDLVFIHALALLRGPEGYTNNKLAAFDFLVEAFREGATGFAVFNFLSDLCKDADVVMSCGREFVDEVRMEIAETMEDLVQEEEDLDQPIEFADD